MSGGGVEASDLLRRRERRLDWSTVDHVTRATVNVKAFRKIFIFTLQRFTITKIIIIFINKR